MRCEGVAGVIKQAQLVAGPNFVPDLDASFLHVRLEAVEPVAVVDNDGVAVDPRDAHLGELGTSENASYTTLSAQRARSRCPILISWDNRRIHLRS